MTAGLSEALPTSADPVPLAVDVDGTLLCTDILYECALQFIARYPIEAPKLLLWALRSKAFLKRRLVERVDPVVDTMPLRAETVEVIRAAQDAGRPVYLASASEHRIVVTLAERIGGISGVFATTRERNLAGSAKAAALTEAFGAGGYDYIGDMPVDIPVWENARKRMFVAHNSGLERQVRRKWPDAQLVAHARPHFGGYLKAMRPHQWAKNVLVFLALIAGHRFDTQTIIATFVGFVCFCMAASSAYILNDLLDLPGDRDHPRKQKRPFACGHVPIVHGLLLFAILMVVACGSALVLSPRFLFVLLCYVMSTLAYSFVLKRKLIVDVIALGGLYTIRVFAGVALGTSGSSRWLLMFSLFLFLCLALVKRCSELVMWRDKGKLETVGRGYRVEDLEVLMPLASAAGYGAVLVVTLYMSSPEVAMLYSHPGRMWLICPVLLYWVSRILVLAGRGQVHDDPVIFALTDRMSWWVISIAMMIIAISI